jgi:RNA polymerase sigma-70 factor (ECF subfamily)
MSARLGVLSASDGAIRAREAASAEELARAALAGDVAAWAALIARHEHRVVVSLLARGLPIERARELAQETWLRLMEQQRAGRLSALSLPGLAIVQARFLAANEGRRRDATAAALAEEPATAVTLEDEALGKERLARMSRAFAACSPGARRVFEMVYDHPELGYAEVAARVGLSLQRVKQIVCEVRRRLRDAIEEEGE